jgi:hypothetical protein
MLNSEGLVVLILGFEKGRDSFCVCLPFFTIKWEVKVTMSGRDRDREVRVKVRVKE